MTLPTTIPMAQSFPGEYRAGGTDVQERRRHGGERGPLVDISRLTELSDITWRDDGGLSVGALVTLDTLARDADVRQHYPALALSAGALATPQIRRMASLGGALLQRNRCWYYRHPDFTCYKKGGEGCPARTGDHRYHSCFDLGPCIAPHPSTVGMALLAYDADVEATDVARRSVAALYGDGSDPHHDHLLPRQAILLRIHLPAPTPSERAAYFRAISRARAEWPLVESVVRLVVIEGQIRLARVGLGGVAPIPLRLPEVEARLEGQPATDESLRAAAALASKGTTPLPMTGYKVPLIEGTVYETLQQALASGPDAQELPLKA